MITVELKKENEESISFDKNTVIDAKGIVEMLDKIDKKLNRAYLTFKLTLDNDGVYYIDVVKKPITRTRKGNSSKFDLGSVLTRRP